MKECRNIFRIYVNTEGKIENSLEFLVPSCTNNN